MAIAGFVLTDPRIRTFLATVDQQVSDDFVSSSTGCWIWKLQCGDYKDNEKDFEDWMITNDTLLTEPARPHVVATSESAAPDSSYDT